MKKIALVILFVSGYSCGKVEVPVNTNSNSPHVAVEEGADAHLPDIGVRGNADTGLALTPSLTDLDLNDDGIINFEQDGKAISYLLFDVPSRFVNALYPTDQITRVRASFSELRNSGALDITGNGKIDVVDGVLIARYIAGRRSKALVNVPGERLNSRLVEYRINR